jgi:predicted short-subunit dehydrogenase-like oxidoreductase (DUF2520 family)
MPTHYPKVSVIGAGIVGSTIAIALFEKGYSIASIIDRIGGSAIGLARSVKCKKASTQITDIAPNSNIILIAVSDDAIETVALQLSKVKINNFKKLLVIHCSGVYSADILQPIRKKCAATASMHPIQTFPTSQRGGKLLSKLKGIYYGIDGDPEAIQMVEKIVQELGGKSVVIQKELKPLYHIACVFASNYMTMFLNAVNDLARTLNLKASWTEVFGPLMTTTMENVVRESAPSALTGPIVRNDISTIELHLKTLLQYAPQFLPLYTIGGIEIARIAKENQRINQESFNDIVAKFRKFIQTNSIKKITKVKK